MATQMIDRCPACHQEYRRLGDRDAIRDEGVTAAYMTILDWAYGAGAVEAGEREMRHQETMRVRHLLVEAFPCLRVVGRHDESNGSE